MNIVTDDYGKLKEEINNLLYIIEHKKLKDQMAALASIEGIMALLENFDKSIFDFDISILEKPYLLTSYAQKMSSNYKNFKKNFIQNKEFHQKYLKDILTVIDENLGQIDDTYRSMKTTYLTDCECYDIMLEYARSVNKYDLFKELVKNKRIFELDNNDLYNGEALNIMNNENSFIFLNNFSNDVMSMTTLIHEFGHIDDFNIANKKYSINEINNQNLMSVYNEVNSKYHEKKFLHYLIDNNILKDEAIDTIIDLYWKDYDEILATYILSLLPDKVIFNEKYVNMDGEKIKELLPKKFPCSGDIIESLELDLQEDVNYCYGAIVSEFLDTKEEREKFYNNYRGKYFDERYLINNEFTKDNFAKIYSKKLYKIR